MQLRLISCLAVLACLGGGLAAQSALAGGGNSDAAHACQQGGYLDLTRSDGSHFENAGDCVSYAAHGGQFPACVVTPTSGCIVYDNQTFDWGGFATLTIDGAFSFSTTACPDDCLRGFLTPNELATGAATVTITDNSTGELYLQGTLTAANTVGTAEGLGYVSYGNDSGASTCSAATSRTVSIDVTSKLTGGTVLEAVEGTTTGAAYLDTTSTTIDGYLGDFQTFPYFGFNGFDGEPDQTTISC
jgi:hypothetical protein